MITTLPQRRTAALAAALLSATLVLAACGDDDDSGGGAGEMRSFQADNGTVDIPADPQRIVTIANSTPVALELGVEPVGVTLGPAADTRWFTPDELEAYEAATDVGAESGVDFEKIASLQPDLIVLLAPMQVLETNWSDGRLESIAPTVQIAFAPDWEGVSRRVADALGELGTFEDQKRSYEEAVARIRSEHAGISTSDTFVSINRFSSTDAGSFDVESAGFGCNNFAADAGIRLPVTDVFEFPTATTGVVPVSFERLTDLDRFDTVLYPLDPDGMPKKEMSPVLDSDAWKALSTVASGHATGVQCRGTNTYAGGIFYLESLDTALASLPASE